MFFSMINHTHRKKLFSIISMALSLTESLHVYGLLDSEGFLVPPEHPSVEALTRRMVELMDLQATGLKLGGQDKLSLHAMQIAFDYYNEALQDLEEDEDNDFIDDSPLEDNVLEDDNQESDSSSD